MDFFLYEGKTYESSFPSVFLSNCKRAVIGVYHSGADKFYSGIEKNGGLQMAKVKFDATGDCVDDSVDVS